MSLSQDSMPLTLPTTTDIKRRIGEHETTTREALALIQSRLNTRSRLSRLLDERIDRAATLREPRTVRQAIKDFLRGESASDRERRVIRHEGEAALRKMHLVHTILKDQGYREVDHRTQVHYDDIKALTLLDISGDAEAEEFHQRSMTAISLLRAAQREIEGLGSVERERLRFDEEMRD